MKNRWVFAIPAVPVAFVVIALVASQPASSAEKTSAALVARGDYLATTSGCKDCHTPGFFYGASDKARELSGSEVGWQGPWGTTYAANLTPDIETGLGAWSDEDIMRAFRSGVRPDKTVLRPPMPWQNLAVMNDDDARAIVAYLRSLPPIKHQEPTALKPGDKAKGSVFVLPPPPAWDAPKAVGK